MNAPIDSGLFWRRQGRDSENTLKHVAHIYQTGGQYVSWQPLEIVPMDGMGGPRRMFVVYLCGQHVTEKRSLKAAKKVAENYLRLELDIALRGLAALCTAYTVRFTHGVTYPWGVYHWLQDEPWAAYATEQEAREEAAKMNHVAAVMARNNAKHSVLK